MPLVEQSRSGFLPLWAEKIEVERDGNVLLVTGKSRVKAAGAPASGFKDLFREYTKFAAGTGEKRTGRRPPHVQFANANDDASRVKFVSRFGPVWGDMSAHLPSATDVETFVRVRESLLGLRREQGLISAVIRLAALVTADEAAEPEVI